MKDVNVADMNLQSVHQHDIFISKPDYRPCDLYSSQFYLSLCPILVIFHTLHGGIEGAEEE
jgi:hypothetical protein